MEVFIYSSLMVLLAFIVFSLNCGDVLWETLTLLLFFVDSFSCGDISRSRLIDSFTLFSKVTTLSPSNESCSNSLKNFLASARIKGLLGLVSSSLLNASDGRVLVSTRLSSEELIRLPAVVLEGLFVENFDVDGYVGDDFK